MYDKRDWKSGYFRSSINKIVLRGCCHLWPGFVKSSSGLHFACVHVVWTVTSTLDCTGSQFG